MINWVRFLFFLSSILIFSLLQSSFTHIFSNTKNDFKEISYKITPSSKLEVFGTTNINSFCCASKEQFKTKSLSYKLDQEHATIYFHQATFSIEVEQLDCGKKPINKDLFEALQSNQYPNIIIDMKEVYNLECDKINECDKWISFEANTDVTITCKTQSISIPLLVKQLDTGSYRITGGTSLQLCDFDVEAPTAMLGLIQVQDKIDLNFDLYVDVD